MIFLHLSDLHIGRRLNGISLMDDQRHILRQAVELAKGCDAVLLAGDLYDKAQPSSEAIHMVGDFLAALNALEKPVFAVSGNHDSPEQVAYCRELLSHSGVYMSPAFDGKPQRHVLKDAHGEVHVWLLPFLKPSSVRPYFPDVHSYQDAVSAALSAADIDMGVRNVLVSHQYVGGASVCDSETRLIGGVDQIGTDLFHAFDYVALGHLHSPQSLCNGRVRYAGSPLAYSFSEEHQKKAALLVTLENKGELSVATQPFEPLRRVRTVRGKLSEIATPELHSDDYVYAVVTDEDALVDPLGTLRLTYPNLAGMRIQNSRTNTETTVQALPDASAQTPLEHFMAFYAMQNNQQPPDERRIAMMKQTIQEAEEKQHEAR